MTEKEIVTNFRTTYFQSFKDLLKKPYLRVYSFELALEIEGTKKFTDLVLINEDPSKPFYQMQMFVLEFKKNNIDYGPIDQLHMYVENVHKKYYRKNTTVGILVAPSFSKFELSQCKKYGYHALQFDNHFNFRFLV